MKAIWNGKVIAESNETIKIENNHYFPGNSVNKEFLKNSKVIRILFVLGKEKPHILI